MKCKYDHQIQINYFPRQGLAQLWMEGDLIDTYPMFDVEAAAAKNKRITCVHCKEALVVDFQTR
jgi:hypothetical protein